MRDIGKYRKGYEEMKEEIKKDIAEIRNSDPIGDLPKQTMKGLNPMNFLRELSRSKDEGKGRSDAAAGREFNPSDEDDD